MNLFKKIFSELQSFKSIEEALKNNISPISASGLSHIHRAQLIYTRGREKNIVLAITGTEAEAKKLCDDINMMAGEETAVLFPSKELVFTPVEGVNREYEYMRIAALDKASKGKCSVICGSIEAVMQPVIPFESLSGGSIALKEEEEIDLKELCRKLSVCGYQRCEKVEGASQFSVRGSIIDIFPVQSAKPVRIELWGDAIDSISEFETDSQKDLRVLIYLRRAKFFMIMTSLQIKSRIYAKKQEESVQNWFVSILEQMFIGFAPEKFLLTVINIILLFMMKLRPFLIISAEL